MITLENEWDIKEISEENVDLLKVMAHPVRLQIVNEL
ncbi:transcriptional regulator, partial [Bacillus toyonensis]